MKFKSLFIVVFQLGALLAQAEDPLYTVKLKSAKTFEVISGPSSLDFYPLSGNAAGGFGRKGTRNVVGADYRTGIKIKTKQPQGALQEVMGQIVEQTGLMLGYFTNTNLEQIAPVALLQGFSETAVINLLLTPMETGEFLLTCTYLIDARPDGSVDGTPAAIAQMQERLRQMHADSTATALPVKFEANELKAGDYFRRAQNWTVSSPTGETQTTVMFLLLKKGDDYTLGLYREQNGQWLLFDQPIELNGFRAPSCYGRGKVMALRASKKSGQGGIDIFVENGRVIKKDFSE